MLTDHGTKLHGWFKKDYDYSHNIGRGATLYGFRNFLMNNVGLDVKSVDQISPPYKIVFQQYSSRASGVRSLNFKEQINAVTREFDKEIKKKEIIVETYTFSEHPIEEQMQITSKTSILITACGGGAVTAMFLPKGAGLIMYYNDVNKGEKQGTNGKTPAHLDWDFLNNAAYLRTHWMPISTRKSPTDLNVFLNLVRNEIETISHH
mmetsp:Transcript_2050/g.2097  ORF Transcript_2050/g.2097 Transcript_2050/m.2097 type:complete len:206 (-) Transcript_2050:100-717(-)